jgi:excisionase family DNA binding protein
LAQLHDASAHALSASTDAHTDGLEWRGDLHRGRHRRPRRPLAPPSPAAYSLAVPDELIDAIADEAARRVAAREDRQPESWVSADRAASHLACSRQRIYDLVHARTVSGIPFRKDGPRLLFRLSELDAWLADGGNGQGLGGR